jgi:DNA-directed RNA polymerase subunit RPC12/RpoP
MGQGTRINVVEGSEGPRCDPYGYHEITVERRGLRVTGHFGLATWVKVVLDTGETMPATVAKNDLAECNKWFAVYAGMTPEQAYTYNLRKQWRCRHCGNKRLTPHRGYPGETIYVCERCDKPSHADQDMSAIE